ncbi:MAG: T9SS type A sorting domain-containing protein [Candidatus Symbiothrix sp.]|jgi:hypothetical protein|nr:T9SS type A sorting domain-containing protein [Candidatus Symbiothrix sp.]
MKKLFTLLGFVLFSVVLVAQRPSGTNVTTLWEKTFATDNLPDYIGTGSNCHAMTFGMMNGNPYLYVVTREPGYLGTHILNPATGEEVGMLINPSDELLDQGSFAINAVEVDEDGVIFVSNMAYQAGKRLNVYMYKNHTAEPKLVYSGPPVAVASKPRLGDRFSITGKYSDGSAKLYFADYGLTIARPQSNLYVLKLVADPGAAGEYVCELDGGAAKVIEVNPDPDCKNNNLALYLSVGSGYYWMSTTGGLYYNNGTTGSQIYYNQFINRSTGISYVGEKNGRHYMAYYEWEPGIAYLVSYTLPETEGGARIEAVTPGLLNPALMTQNAYGYGGVVVSWRGAHPIIYFLVYNYGIGAYEVSTIDTGIKALVADQYAVKQNGSVLQVTGKEDIQSIELVSLTGQLVAASRNSSEISAAVAKGVYLLTVKTASGQRSVQKVLIN